MIDIKSILKNLEIINIGPVISLSFCAFYLLNGQDFSLFTSIAISLMLISIIVFSSLLIMIRCGIKVFIEMKLNMIQVGFLGLSILLPYCIMSYQFFIN